MVTIVKVRACIFIPTAWLLDSEDPATGSRIEYEGDDREFAPHTVNTLRFRVEQEVTVDFRKKEVYAHANTGVSRERRTGPDGRVQYREGRCGTSGITVNDIAWPSAGTATFGMRVSSANPLILDAAAVDYLVQATVRDDGTVTLKGAHDGFPCFEFYKQVDFGSFQMIYTHDHRKFGETVQALARPMDYRFERTV